MHGNKVLITGGLGNLGSWITDYLASENFDVYVLTRKEKEQIPNRNYKIIECDITDLAALQEKLDFDIDYCIHTASYNEFFLDNYPCKALQINTLGTRNLLDILSRKQIQNFVYFSTFHVYGADSGIITEESTLSPRNDYASTHLFAEYYVKQFGYTHDLQYTILRLTNSYGCPTFKSSDKWYLVLNDLVKSAYENKKVVIKSNGKAKRDFIYMGDVVKVVKNILNLTASNEIYNLSSSHSYEILELAQLVKAQYKKRYSQDIDIKINNLDHNIYEAVLVDNSKLKAFVSYEAQDAMIQEINNIFSLLEGE